MRKFMIAFGLAAASFNVAAPALAATTQKFSQQAFEAAVRRGEPVLVDVKASWCPTCASQDRTIKATIADPRFARLKIFELDYDSQKPQWQALRVNKQGTLIGYRGGREAGRLQFVTDKVQITGLLDGLVR